MIAAWEGSVGMLVECTSLLYLEIRESNHHVLHKRQGTIVQVSKFSVVALHRLSLLVNKALCFIVFANNL